MMTRIRTRKSVDADYWRGRLEAARVFQKAAEDAITLAEPGSNVNPAISQIGPGSHRLRRQLDGKTSQCDQPVKAHSRTEKAARRAWGGLADGAGKPLSPHTGSQV